MERGKKRRHSDKKRHSSESDNDDDSGSDNSSSSSDSSSDEESSVEESPPVKVSKKSKSLKHNKKHKSSAKKATKKKSSKKSKRPKQDNMISEEDYFRKSSEFRKWLTEERKIFFSDLTSEKSRKLFRKFVRKWNNELLPKQYYGGNVTASINQSSYKWKLSNVDSVELGSVSDSVTSWTSGKSASEQFSPPPQTSKSKPIIGPEMIGPVMIGPAMIGPAMIGPAMIGPVGPLPAGHQASSSDPWTLEEQAETKRKKEKHEAKEFRKYHNMVMDELLPKATGKEARFEKKKIDREKKRVREGSPEVSDSFLMGSSGKGVRERIQRQQQQREKKASSAMEKLSEYQAKERAKAVAILEMARGAKKEGALWQ